MVFSILTLFPEIFFPIFSSSIVGRAQKSNRISIRLINIRDFATDTRKTVDDRPYGGSVGMILKIDVLYSALQASFIRNLRQRIILLDPAGKLFNQARAVKYTGYGHLILICGHYEGIDQRINNFIDEKLSVGRYILTGGEIPAMIVADAVTRLIPGVLKKNAVQNESFSKTYKIEPPQYTRPLTFKGYKVPSVLLSGNHGKINLWQKKHSNKSF